MKTNHRPPDMDGLAFYGFQKYAKPTPRALTAAATVLLGISAAILAGLFLGFAIMAQWPR